ncbi:MAG TPA: dihydropyrimidinase [Saprospirales bacterium]|nr:dihydropyrimidinase [Saprospirales bacterium]
MHLKTNSGYSADDFYSGSRAALKGGTTTLVDFVTPEKDQTLIQATELRIKEAENSLCDYSFHVSPVEWRTCLPNEIAKMVNETRLRTFKVYMAYKDTIGLDDAEILLVMRAVAKAGGMVLLHCETGDDIESKRKQLIAEKKLSPRYHPVSRPANMEATAVKRAIDLAAEAGCPIYIVHVSTKMSLEYIQKAQSNGQQVFAETCPQYLLLDDASYEGEFDQVCGYVMSPPLRKKEDNEALWEAVRTGIIQTIGTDHCPFKLEQKRLGRHNFTLIPNGAGGVEHRMTLLYSYGVLTGKISVNQFVSLTSYNAAKILGLYPQKGLIAAGSDADLIVWNTEKNQVISVGNHHSQSDINIYDGFKTKGSPDVVVKNGQIVYVSGAWSEFPGRFLETNPF